MWAAGAAPPASGRTGARPRSRLRLACDHRLAALLASGEVLRAVGQLGVAIILLTVLIKLVFFPLSAASYKSMAKMKLITPRLQKLREMYARPTEDEPGDDGALQDREDQPARRLLPDPGADSGVHRAVLGPACGNRATPRAVHAVDQGPVALDPYYVLPILMTATMILQTRMNPVPPDPVQARVMQIMPFVFSIFFFFFPAGLVLYWLVNNILSIAQQWQIQRMFDRDKPAHAKR